MSLLTVFPKRSHFESVVSYVKQIYGDNGNTRSIYLMSNSDLSLMRDLLAAHELIAQHRIMDYKKALEKVFHTDDVDRMRNLIIKMNGMIAKLRHNVIGAMFCDRWQLVFVLFPQNKYENINLASYELVGSLVLKVAAVFHNMTSEPLCGLRISYDEEEVYSGETNFWKVLHINTFESIVEENFQVAYAPVFDYAGLSNAFNTTGCSLRESERALILLFEDMRRGIFDHLPERFNVISGRFKRIRGAHPAVEFYYSILHFLIDSYWFHKLTCCGSDMDTSRTLSLRNQWEFKWMFMRDNKKRAISMGWKITFLQKL
jgi:hypothetical protein